MAKANTTAAVPFAAMAQIDQLKAIEASQTGGLMLTQSEGAAIVAAGFAQVDTNTVDGDKAFVSLTEAGKAQLQAPAPAPVASGPKPTIVVRSDIPMPTARKRGRAGGSLYPLDTMNVNESFHVPVGPKDKDAAATSSRVSSAVAAARTKYAKHTGEMETVTVKEYQKDANGKIVKDAEGKRIVASTREEQKEKLEWVRDWFVATVDASDPDGPGARVWRTA